jgi:CMP-N-acetylneuraminic acid synthetase
MKVIACMLARGNGSTLKRKNAYPLLGKPMLRIALEEANKAGFIDEIFVWTEDEELAQITRDCGCHVIPRTQDQIFYHGGFSDPNQWGRYRDQYIISKCGTLGDIRMSLNCNYCLMTGEILERMFVSLMEDRSADMIIPVTKVDPYLFMENPKTRCLFPVWFHIGLDRQDYPNLYRSGGISITHSKRGINSFGHRTLYHEVPPEYLIDVHNLEDVKLAEYYLMRRLGGKIVLPDSIETEKSEDKGSKFDNGTISQFHC